MVKKGRIFLGIFMVILLLLAYLDWQVIPGLAGIPKDSCYYHNHDASFLIDRLYVDASGHTEPPFSGLNIILLVGASILASLLLTRKLAH